MKKFLAACLLAAALAASALAAPRAGDLTAGALSGGAWVAFGVRDMDALRKPSAESPLARALNLVPLPKAIDALGAWNLCETFDPNFKKVELCLFAAELNGELSFDDLASLGFGGVRAPDFGVASPAGAAVTPLAVMESNIYAGRLNVALLERGGGRYLIAASGAPAVLTAMAAAPEGGPAEARHVGANVWMRVYQTAGTLAARGVGVSDGMDIELGLTDTPMSLKLVVWTNAAEILSGLAGKDVRGAFSGGVPAAPPLLFGHAPLAALLNVSASFLPEGFRLSDALPAERAGEASSLEERAVGELARFGFGWDDVVKILRGNITLGLAGKFHAPMIGEVPGLYLNVSGIDAAKAAVLVEMCVSQLGGAFGEAEPYDAGGWKGYHFGGMFTGLIAAGEKGLLAAAMDTDRFGEFSCSDPGLAAATEPRNFAFALNTKALRPVLRRIFDTYGDEILGMGGDAAKARSDEIDTIIDGLKWVDAISLVSEDAETFALEVTPSAFVLNVLRLLPGDPSAALSEGAKTAAR